MRRNKLNLERAYLISHDDYQCRPNHRETRYGMCDEIFIPYA